MKKFVTIGTIASLSVALAAMAAINSQQNEISLPKRAAKVQQLSTVKKISSDEKKYSYTLYGKSMFDADGNNVFRFGGDPVRYGVDISFDAVT